MVRLSLIVSLCLTASGEFAQSGCKDERASNLPTGICTQSNFKNDAEVAVKLYGLNYSCKQ